MHRLAPFWPAPRLGCAFSHHLSATLTAVLIAALTGCSGGSSLPGDLGDAGVDAPGDGSGDGPSDVPSDGPFDAPDIGLDRGDAGPEGPGLIEVTDRMVLDERGGLLAVDDTTSRLYGAQVFVPVGALSEPTLLSMREGAPRSDPAGEVIRTVMGVGPILELLPEEQFFFGEGGNDFTNRVRVSLPLPAGTPPTGLAISRWSTSFWRPAEAEGGQLVAVGPAAPPAKGPRVVFETDRFGAYRATYAEVREASVRNSQTEALTVSLTAQDYDTQERWGYTPPPLDPAAFSDLPIPAGQAPFLLLVPGTYLVEAVTELGARYCVEMSIFPNSPPPQIAFFAGMPPCQKPEASLSADATEVAPSGTVTLTGVISDAVAANASGEWQWTGGALANADPLLWPSGEQRTATWTAPEQPGTYWVSLIGYAAAMDQAVVAIDVVADNGRPAVGGLGADPPSAGHGAPSVSRAFAEPGQPGVVRLTVEASDPDGDALTAHWFHALPGSFHDVESGFALGRSADGTVEWPDTHEPYTATSVLYQAPPSPVDEPFAGGSAPFRLALGVAVSDGVELSWAFAMAEVDPTGEPGGGEDAGVPDADAGLDQGPNEDLGPGPDLLPPTGGLAGSCRPNDTFCLNFTGSAYQSDPSLMTQLCDLWDVPVLASPCPAGGSLGACTTYVGQAQEQSTVFYGEPAAADAQGASCRGIPAGAGGPGLWQSPYVPPE